MTYKKLVVILVILVMFYITFYYFLEPKVVEPPSSNKLPEEKLSTPRTTIETLVLETLLENGKYCEVVNYGSEGNEFFLLCNERPFYAEYTGKVSFEHNGWSFLEDDQELWNDLSDCDFYKSEKITSNEYELTFYCPRDLFPQPEEMTAKIYRFYVDSFEITKTGEGNFFDVLVEDLKERYDLEGCEMKSIGFIDESVNFFTLDIVFDCGNEYEVLFDLSSMVVLQPPILADKSKTDLERVQTSFENIFDECSIEEINQNENIEINALCDEFDVLLTYSPLNDYYLMRYEIKIRDTSLDEIKNAIGAFGKYSMFPPYEFEEIIKVGNELYLLDDKAFNVVVCDGGKLCSAAHAQEKIVMYHTLIKVPEG